MTYLSVVIPAYNEEKRLPSTMMRVARYLGSTFSLPTEVLIVENGSTDDTRAVAARHALTCREDYGSVTFRIMQSQKGKGKAVKKGMLSAVGEWVFMCDADLSMPIYEVNKLLPPLARGDVNIGSRAMPTSRVYGQPQTRAMMGRWFNLLSRLVVPGIKDTQCGFKVFNRSAAQDIFRRVTVEGWAFDVEVLFLARALEYQINEVGVNWYYSEESKVQPVRDSFDMAVDVIRLWSRG